jgi:hypothetical protein
MKESNAQPKKQASVASKDSKGKAVFEPHSGRVRGSVWENQSLNTGKVYYKTSVRRIERDGSGDEYLANSFWPEDLTGLASGATACRIWLQDNTGVFEEQREWKAAKAKRSKKRDASKAKTPDSDSPVSE